MKNVFVMEGGERLRRMGGLIFGVLCIGLLGGLLASCNTKREVDENFIQQIPQFNETENSSEDENIEIELIALAKDQEEAEKIAELYGIELDSFSEGVAVYTTDKDPQDLKELGDINGYPTLTVNNTFYQLKEFTDEDDSSN